MHLKSRWLVALGLLGFALVAWLLWAMNETSPPPWPVVVADVVAVIGLFVAPWLVIVARQLSRVGRGEPEAVAVYSRVLVAVAILGVGGPVASVLFVALFSDDVAHPEIAAGLGGLSIVAAAAVAIVGGVLMPWFFVVTRTLARERARRARAEERAEVAAHLHDSVLQALTLIQKHADDSPAVRRLARGTERELRALALRATPAPAEADFAVARAGRCRGGRGPLRHGRRAGRRRHLPAGRACARRRRRRPRGAHQRRQARRVRRVSVFTEVDRRRGARPRARPGPRLRSGRSRCRPARHRRLDRGADAPPRRPRRRSARRPARAPRWSCACLSRARLT